MLSAARSSSKTLLRALVLGGSRQSGLVATRRLQVRGVQSVAQTDRVASAVSFCPSPCKFSSSYDPDTRKFYRRRLLDSCTRLEPSVKSNVTYESSPRLPIPLNLQSSPSSKLEVPSSTNWMSWPSVSVSYTALDSTPSFCMVEDPSSTISFRGRELSPSTLMVSVLQASLYPTLLLTHLTS